MFPVVPQHTAPDYLLCFTLLHRDPQGITLVDFENFVGIMQIEFLSFLFPFSALVSAFTPIESYRRSKLSADEHQKMVTI
jgi:hypothetical protein